MTANGERGLRTSRASGDRVLAGLSDAGWDDLVGRRPVADPLRRTAWLEAWRQEAGRDVEPRSVTIERGGETVAAAPLEAVSRGGLRIVRHLGHADAWFDIEPPAADAAARAALLSAVAAEPGDILLLDGLCADEDAVDALRAQVPHVRLTSTETWRLTLSDPPRSLRKRRKEAGRATRRAADRGITLSHAWSADWSYIGRRLGTLLDLHVAHFPGDGPNLLAGPGVRRRFAERAIAAMGTEGRARLVEVSIEGGPLVAWDLALLGDGGGAVAYAGAFDRSREDLMTLGWISMLAMIEGLGEEGVEIVDFGPGPAPYKDLVARAVPMVRATAPLSRRGHVALGLHRAVRTLRERRGAGGDGDTS